MEEEKEVINRAKNGDERALSLIYQRYFNDIYRYTYLSAGSAELAEDLTEEVFFRVLKYIQNYDEEKATFKSWIFRIAHNLVVDYFRSKPRYVHEALDEQLGVEDGQMERMEERIYQEEARKLLKESLNRLTDEQRQVILMKYFLGMSNLEVGEVMGKRKGAINSLQNRALKRMGAYLRERGYGAVDKLEG